MNIQSRLNIVALLSAGTLFGLYIYMWVMTDKIDNQLYQIEDSYHFSKTASQLSILTEQYMAYGEERFLESWENLFADLHETGVRIEFIEKNVIHHALPSIQGAFMLIRNVKEYPELYPDDQQRELLLDRAQARIRSDIQILLSASQNNVERRIASIQQIHVDQRYQFLMFVIPAVLIIALLIFVLHKNMLRSLHSLLSGTRAMADGDLSSRIREVNIEEHQRVADAFNVMAEKLQGKIEEERKTRKEAQENQKRWEMLVEQDPNLILIHVNGIIRFINTAGADLIGFEHPNKLTGKSIFEFVGPDQHQLLKERLHLLHVEKKNAPAITIKLNTLTGKERYIQIESKPIRFYGEDAIQTVGLDITSHVEYENKLERSIQEKNTLLQEIHHRVKNNLAVVSSLISMKKFDVDNQEVKTILTESEMQIKSMALIHEKIYNSSDFTRVSLNEYITDIFSSIRDAFLSLDDVCLSMECTDDIHLNLNQAVPTALILNELFTNSFKHAFKDVETKQILIVVKKRDHQLHIHYKDSGTGFNEEFDSEQDSSLGLTIIQTLVLQLDAEIEMYNDNGAVTDISFEIRDIRGSAGNLLV
jgi:PAS domain S-box-containing protein